MKKYYTITLLFVSLVFNSIGQTPMSTFPVSSVSNLDDSIISLSTNNGTNINTRISIRKFLGSSLITTGRSFTNPIVTNGTFNNGTLNGTFVSPSVTIAGTNSNNSISPLNVVSMGNSDHTITVQCSNIFGFPAINFLDENGELVGAIGFANTGSTQYQRNMFIESINGVGAYFAGAAGTLGNYLTFINGGAEAGTGNLVWYDGHSGSNSASAKKVFQVDTNGIITGNGSKITNLVLSTNFNIVAPNQQYYNYQSFVRTTNIITTPIFTNNYAGGSMCQLTAMLLFTSTNTGTTAVTITYTNSLPNSVTTNIISTTNLAGYIGASNTTFIVGSTSGVSISTTCTSNAQYFLWVSLNQMTTQ